MVLQVAGRGRLVATASVLDGDRLAIRLDDDRDEAFWAELTLSQGQLAELLNVMRNGGD